LSPGGSGYFTCIQNMKLVTTKFKSGGLHEKHVVATWNLGNHLSICFWTQGNQEKPVSRWPVAGPSEYWLLASSPASKVKNSNMHIVQQIHIRWQQYTQDNYNNTHKTTNNNYTQDNLNLATIHTRQITIQHVQKVKKLKFKFKCLNFSSTNILRCLRFTIYVGLYALR